MKIPTKKAAKFIKANDESRVMSGSAKGRGGEGGTYRLLDGRVFELSLEDMQSLPKGYPKWMHHG